MDKSFLAPVGQTFEATGISNAKESRDKTDWMGINDFAVFSPYYHYYPAGATPGVLSGEPRPIYIDYRVDYMKPIPRLP